MNPLLRLTVASRVFCLAAIVGLGLVTGDRQSLVILLVVAAAATTAVYISVTTPLATVTVVAAEAAVAGLVIGLVLPEGVILLPYLAVLTLIAGVSGGVFGVSAVLVVQFFAIGVVGFTSGDITARELLWALSPWLLTSIGVGLLGSWLRRLGKVPRLSADHATYESAHRLLTQLRAVARRLSSGLEPLTIATYILDDVGASTSMRHGGLFVSTSGGILSPLAYSNEASREGVGPPEEAINTCWAEMAPVVNAVDDGSQFHSFVLPLRVGSRMLGVIAGELQAAPSTEVLAELMQRLDEHSLRLETALTFDEVRTIATVEERRRLAREIHDGIAQEVASLGYLVDDLHARAESDEQQSGLSELRRELTRVVSELRLSIFDLRSDALGETGLGSALSEYVRQVGARSAMTVHLSLDESPTRLRPEVEIELLRIAQEAITNARKHSGATNLWVSCRVQPPFAEVEVRDDGGGLSAARSDSHGLQIIKERTERLDARLEIQDATDTRSAPGTLVRVTLGSRVTTQSRTESEPRDDITATADGLAGRRPRPHPTGARAGV